MNELKKEANKKGYDDSWGVKVLAISEVEKLIDKATQAEAKRQEQASTASYLFGIKDGEKAQKKKDANRWQPVIDAWTNEGPVPSYHKNMMYNLKRDWPTLYKAIASVIESQGHE
ncbi:MAG TPA: hypothetical protein ENI23_17100 [bacterium]|nr:hypothetical protein [bacterium]